MTQACDRLDGETLVGYWLGELDATREASVDEHLFACAACAARLADVVRLARAIRTSFAQGNVSTVVTPAFVADLAAAGCRLREYRVPANGSVHCSVAPDDDFSVARLEAPLEGVERLDVVRMAHGEVLERLANVPFDARAGEVVYAPAIAALRTLHDQAIHVELVDVRADAERVIAGYDFMHTAWKA